jgi:hypothetical protein
MHSIKPQVADENDKDEDCRGERNAPRQQEREREGSMDAPYLEFSYSIKS